MPVPLMNHIKIRTRLKDVCATADGKLEGKNWAEGYLNALADVGLLSTREYDGLMDWVVAHFESEG